MVTFGGLDTNAQEVYRFENKGDVFGESAVKQIKSVRTASIIATSPCTTLELSRENYLRLQKDGKLKQNENVTVAVVNLQENLRRKSESNAANQSKIYEKLKKIKEDNIKAKEAAEKAEIAAKVVEKIKLKKLRQQAKMQRLMGGLGNRRIKKPNMKALRNRPGPPPSKPNGATKNTSAPTVGIKTSSPPAVGLVKILPTSDLQTLEAGLQLKNPMPPALPPVINIPVDKINEICVIGYSKKVAEIALRRFNLDVPASLNWLMSDPVELEDVEEEEEGEEEEEEEEEQKVEQKTEPELEQKIEQKMEQGEEKDKEK